MPKSISICGLICSGKSSVITELHNLHSWDVISFGKYVREIASLRGLLPTRETYQALGYELFDELGAASFLAKVIEANQPKSDVHLFDGVRHTSILDSMKLIYETNIVVYLELSDSLRFRRYKSRSTVGDNSTSFEQFLEISKHPIEQGISDIKSLADLRIDATSRLGEIVVQINNYLVNINFTR